MGARVKTHALIELTHRDSGPNEGEKPFIKIQLVLLPHGLSRVTSLGFQIVTHKRLHLL